MRLTTRLRRTILAAASGLAVLGLASSALAAPGAPAGRYTLTTNTVTDTATGLTWQRGGETQTYSWVSALAYCRNLRLDGLSGWRLPSVKEQQTLVDERAAGAPTIDRTAFPTATSTFVWSSTPSAATPDRAWGIDFSNGSAVHRSTSGGYVVRCVR